MNQAVNSNVFKHSIKYIILVGLVVVSLIVAGTFAWLTYRSNKTKMVLTISDFKNVEITLSPYVINTKLSPVATYTGEKYTSVKAQSTGTVSKNFSLYYKINSIASELAISSFKYTITKSTNGTSYSHLKTGNFNGATSNSQLNILEETLPAGETYYYRVYIWLDSSGGNQTAASGKSFNGELMAEIA